MAHTVTENLYTTLDYAEDGTYEDDEYTCSTITIRGTGSAQTQVTQHSTIVSDCTWFSQRLNIGYTVSDCSDTSSSSSSSLSLSTASSGYTQNLNTNVKFIKLLRENKRIRQMFPPKLDESDKIGEGSLFEVFAFKHPTHGVPLAVKRPSFPDRTLRGPLLREARWKLTAYKPEQLRSLYLEIRALTDERLYNHPNIVKLIYWSFMPSAAPSLLDPLKVPVIALERAQFSLKQALESGILEFNYLDGKWVVYDIFYELETKLGLFRDIAQGLAAMHSSGLIHGDLKPHNILLFRQDSSFWVAKLADFGLAEDTNVSSLQQFRLSNGTPGWRAPELERGIGPTHGRVRCDIFSYGCVCWSMYFNDCRPPSDKIAPRLLAVAEEAVRNAAFIPRECKPFMQELFVATMPMYPASRALDMQIIVRLFENHDGVTDILASRQAELSKMVSTPYRDEYANLLLLLRNAPIVEEKRSKFRLELRNISQSLSTELSSAPAPRVESSLEIPTADVDDAGAPTSLSVASSLRAYITKATKELSNTMRGLSLTTPSATSTDDIINEVIACAQEEMARLLSEAAAALDYSSYTCTPDDVTRVAVLKKNARRAYENAALRWSRNSVRDDGCPSGNGAAHLRAARARRKAELLRIDLLESWHREEEEKEKIKSKNVMMQPGTADDDQSTEKPDPEEVVVGEQVGDTTATTITTTTTATTRNGEKQQPPLIPDESTPRSAAIVAGNSGGGGGEGGLDIALILKILAKVGRHKQPPAAPADTVVVNTSAAAL